VPSPPIPNLTISRCPAAPALLGTDAPTCALTVDVEDWYQSSVDFDAPISERVLHNMDRLRAILDPLGVKATFFVQGMVAERFPKLAQDLVADGHEVQSHGYSHRPLYAMDRAALRVELDVARKSLEDACGVRATAFRAPDFSIMRENLWALEVLAETGFDVDSSIFPMKLKRYGLRGWELAPHQITFPSGASILEAPVAVLTAAGLPMPVAGGGYFRLLPRWVLEKALSSVLADGRPAIIYCHPYEFCPRELDSYRGLVSPAVLFTQGLGRASFVERVKGLLSRFRFGRLDEVLNSYRSHGQANGSAPTTRS
jgi:polysaccharide deacetylase family protein (PEP-CTERM system associated)